MKGIQNIFVAGCSVFLLCQCATQDDVRKLNYQVRAVNQKVEDVKNTTVDKMQKRQANSLSKIDQVDQELLRLNSLIEENSHIGTQYREQNSKNLEALQAANDERFTANEQKITELEQQVQQLAASLESMQQARIRAAEERAREAARKAEQARKRTVAAASTPSELVRVTPSAKKVQVGTGKVVSAAPVAGPAQETKQKSSAPPASDRSTDSSVQTVAATDTASDPFDRAMEKFKSKKYKEAYHDFEQVLANNPKGEKAAQTLFYMGESLYSQGEYDLAILDYQKVISNHGKDSHTPAALLKQGMSFEKLTDNETAKIIYKKLINEYSGSSEATTAEERLKNL